MTSIKSFFVKRSLCSTSGPIQSAIKEKLTALFKPSYLQITNESANHASNLGQESHFRIAIVSKDFENIGDVMRHRLIKKALQQEFDAGSTSNNYDLLSKDVWRVCDSLVPVCQGRLNFQKSYVRTIPVCT
ncbi:unnamed protein product [Mesocestoides corti]|uniref:Uncharacterized protein n=1 Tax=Mesocestoides corti TaxID=53468 RepID=A0A0R3UC84_MESCO|nr:unnamed protein product [Mesocestoides corti]